jgi:hypothetical protein
VVPRDGGLGGQVADVRVVQTVAVDEFGAEVERGRQEHDAVEVHTVLLQHVHQHGRARRAVRFAEQEFRRIPAAVLRDIPLNELFERSTVLIDAVELFRLGVAEQTAESGPGRVDEDHVGFVEQAVFIIDEAVRRRRRVLRVGGHHALRAK